MVLMCTIRAVVLFNRFAFVTFCDPEDAKNAIAAANTGSGLFMDGKKLKVEAKVDKRQNQNLAKSFKSLTVQNIEKDG